MANALLSEPFCLICKNLCLGSIVLKVPPALICCQFRIMYFPWSSLSRPLSQVCVCTEHCVLPEKSVLKASPTSTGSSQCHGAVGSFVYCLHYLGIKGIGESSGVPHPPPNQRTQTASLATYQGTVSTHVTAFWHKKSPKPPGFSLNCG